MNHQQKIWLIRCMLNALPHNVEYSDGGAFGLSFLCDQEYKIIYIVKGPSLNDAAEKWIAHTRKLYAECGYDLRDRRPTVCN